MRVLAVKAATQSAEPRPCPCSLLRSWLAIRGHGGRGDLPGISDRSGVASRPVFRGLILAAVLALALTLSAVAPVYAVDPSPAVTPGASAVIIDPLDPRAGEGR